MGNLTKNFNLSEFSCHDISGTPVPDKYLFNVQGLANQLQVLRDFIGEPIRINSGYRTPAYNRKIGGAKSSQHLTASAADIAAENYTPNQLAAVVENLIIRKKLWFGGLGIYPGWIHVDIRKTVARW